MTVYKIKEEEKNEIHKLLRETMSLIREKRLREARHKQVKIETVLLNLKVIKEDTVPTF